MEDANQIFSLRSRVSLLDGETLFEGWFAQRQGAGADVPSLVMLTSWRLIIIDEKNRFSAVPISKIDAINIHPPAALRVTSWYERLEFDMGSTAAVATLINSLRQNPDCPAKVAVITPVEISDSVCEDRRCSAKTPAFAVGLPPNARPRDPVKQPLLMVEPSL